MLNLFEIFRQEADDLLVELEDALLELENDPSDLENVNRIFRAMHTIKGSGAMVGCDNISSFTHELETTFDLVRNGKLTASKELLDISLAAQSWINDMLDTEDKLTPELRVIRDELLDRIHKLLNQHSLPTSSSEASDLVSEMEPDVDKNGPPEPEHDRTTYRIQFKPNDDFFEFGSNPITLLSCLHELGDCKAISYVEEVPNLEAIKPLNSYLHWDILLTTTANKDDILDVFIFDEQDCTLNITAVDHEGEENSDYKRLGDILLERGDITKAQLDAILPQPKKVGEIIEQAGLVSHEVINAALAEQTIIKEQRQQKQKQKSNEFVRVPAEKLESQMDLVGELVIALASLNSSAESHESTELSNACEELNQLITELRDNVLSIRMMQIGSTFSRFRRVVRDLAQKQNKSIELETFGAETELDKNVIDQLNDPLVHLIRNGIDHGLETPEEREKAGKNPIGKLELSAQHTQGQVIIRIKDDGKGIDPNVIRNKAINKGLLDASENIDDKDVLPYIFAPGFSTAETVTDISGRGVGMDVVKRTIEDLRGTIDIDSEIGKGTTITLKLPLTLAIIEGLLVEVEEEVIAIPLTIIKECIEVKKSELSRSSFGYLATVRGYQLPCISLREWAGIEGPTPELMQLVVVNVDNEEFAFIVDDIIQQQQIVIKNLGSVYRHIDSVSGATILGDGSVALIIDAFQIVKNHLNGEGLSSESGAA